MRLQGKFDAMQDILKEIVKSAAKAGALEALETLGLAPGEISQRKARDIYGKWFTDAEKAGRIRPARVDDGRNGTKHYRVVDIQQLKTSDLVRAELQLNR